MAFQGISSDSASAALLLHDQFKDNVIQTFGEIEEFKLFEAYKAAADKLPAEKREYKIRVSEGSKSIGARNVSARVLPRGQEVRYTEGEYQVKRYDMSLEFGLETLAALERAVASNDITSGAFQSANEHVNDIIKARTNVLAHLKLIDCYNDGTGVIGQVASIDADNADGTIVVTLKSGPGTRGSITFLRLGLDLVAASPAGVLRTFSTAVPAVLAVDSFTVDSIDVANNRFTATLRNAAGVALTANATSTVVENDYIYMSCKKSLDDGDEELPDLSGAIADYDSISAHIVGLRGLVRADGATVQGLVRSGMHASQVINKGGATALDPKFLTELLIQCKRRMAGSMSSYKWNRFLMSEEALDFMIRSQMAYRALNVAHAEAARGVPVAYGATKFNYVESVSGKSEAWEFTASCFCPMFEMYAMPQAGKNDRGLPIGFAYTEMQDPFADWSSNDGFLPVIDGNGRYNLAKISHKRMWSCMYSEVPFALGKLEGFTLS